MGLINLGILSGLLAVGIPIAIHLIRSRRYVLSNIGTLRFIQQAMTESRRWQRLRELLLLLLRILIILLLTFLFARPFFKDPNQPEKKAMSALVLLDASGSMNGEILGVDNFTLAREEAKKLLGDLPEEAEITIAAFGENLFDLNDLEEVTLKPGGKTNYHQVLNAARDRFSLSESEEKKVFLFTDLQKKGLPTEPFKDWPLDIQVEVQPAVEVGAWNAAVLNVQNLSQYLGEEAEIEVQLGFYGEVPAQEYKVILEVEGQSPLIQTIDRRKNLVTYNWSPQRAGIFKGIVKIEGKDAYPKDNVRHFAIQIDEPYNILLVDGAPGKSRFGNETYFIEKALNVTFRKNAQSRFKAERKEYLEDIFDYKIIALCNVEKLEKDEIAELTEFVEKGGSLIYFLGSNVEPVDYAELNRAKIFPAKLRDIKARIPRQILEWDKEHPALKLFDGSESADLSYVWFAGGLKMSADDDAKVLATLANDSPAIIEKSLGRGTILAVSNPADRDWGDWPKDRLFVPVIQELFKYLAGDEEQQNQIREIAPGFEEEREPGCYEKPDEPITVIAADASEADTEMVDESAFRSALGIGEKLEDQKIETEEERPLKSERKNEFWFYLLLGLIVITLLENFVADRG